MYNKYKIKCLYYFIVGSLCLYIKKKLFRRNVGNTVSRFFFLNWRWIVVERLWLLAWIYLGSLTGVYLPRYPGSTMWL